MIRFTCPSCGLALSAPEDCAGRSTKCHGCNNPIVVPQVATTPASARPAKPPVLHDKPAVSASAPPRSLSSPTKTAKPAKSIASVPQQPAQPRKLSMLAKLGIIGAGILFVFCAGGLSGIGVYHYFDSEENAGKASGDMPQAPRDPVPPREPPASKQAHVPESEKQFAPETHNFGDEVMDGDLQVRVFVAPDSALTSGDISLALLDKHPNKVVRWRVWELGPITDEHGNKFFQSGPLRDPTAILSVFPKGRKIKAGERNSLVQGSVISSYSVLPSTLRFDPDREALLTVYYEALPQTSKEASVVATTSSGRKFLFRGKIRR